MIKTAGFLFLVLALSASAQDWPAWRADGNHSAFVSQALPESLTLQWSRDLGKPDPAFDYHFRLCADESYEPVALNGLLFVLSNIGDGVHFDTTAQNEIGKRFAAKMSELLAK